MIQISGLTKRYGNLIALNSVDMTIAAGETVGLIGPNGAGKTTLIKILATLLSSTSGTATIDGRSTHLDAAGVRKVTGYMPDFCGVYEDMRVREYLHLFAATYGLSSQRAASVVDDVLALTDLTGKADAMADSLSRGMQQRLQLARVLLHDPKVLLLDEPASGLDPRARIEIRLLLQELARMGKTILISSHILAELAEVCSSIAIIEEGRLLYHGNVQEALVRTRALRARKILLGITSDQDAAQRLLLEQEGITSVEPEEEHLIVTCSPAWDCARLFDLCVAHQIRLSRLEDERVSLEDAFLHLTNGRVS